MAGWRYMAETGTPLQKIRAGQIIAITAKGTIPYEVPELTQAILQEAWLEEDGTVRFVLLSGDHMP